MPSGILTYLSSPIVLWFVLGVAIATLWQLGSFVEPKGLARSVKFLEPFGDASYSSYLLRVPDQKRKMLTNILTRFRVIVILYYFRPFQARWAHT